MLTLCGKSSPLVLPYYFCPLNFMRNIYLGQPRSKSNAYRLALYQQFLLAKLWEMFSGRKFVVKGEIHISKVYTKFGSIFIRIYSSRNTIICIDVCRFAYLDTDLGTRHMLISRGMRLVILENPQAMDSIFEVVLFCCGTLYGLCKWKFHSSTGRALKPFVGSKASVLYKNIERKFIKHKPKKNKEEFIFFSF